eukprot:scaffold12056_cov155-Skeletonema_menzelii.AAC.1
MGFEKARGLHQSKGNSQQKQGKRHPGRVHFEREVVSNTPCCCYHYNRNTMRVSIQRKMIPSTLSITDLGKANYESIPSEDNTLLPSPLTPAGENYRGRSWVWVSFLHKAAAPLAAIALVLSVSFIAKSIGLGYPHKMLVFQSANLRLRRGGAGPWSRDVITRNKFGIDSPFTDYLWPSNDDGSYPQNCSSEKFDLSNLQPIREELEQKWPNIQAPSSNTARHVDFWEHEWGKHGTCSGLSQLDYFSHALKELIPTPSIVTDAEEQHAVVKKDDLLAAYGGAQLVVLSCWRHYLREVRVCHQKEADGSVGERMECPETILRESSCGSEIKIASFGM